jgi:capsular polysaccharide biosynthesis protein
VDNVSNSFTSNEKIERTTTLSVKRGMILDYVKEVKANDTTTLSYFNIINTKEIENNIVSKLGGEGTKQIDTNTIKAQFSENKEIFDFFLSRKQFDDKIYRTVQDLDTKTDVDTTFGTMIA